MGVGCYAKTSMVSGRLLLHQRCRGSYFCILHLAALGSLDLRLGVNEPTSRLRIKTARIQLFVG
jgi:hypothetical protein